MNLLAHGHLGSSLSISSTLKGISSCNKSNQQIIILVRAIAKIITIST